MSNKYQDRDETNRSHFVNVRLSDDEWEQLNIICELLDENRSKYIRRRIFTGRIPRPVFQYALDEATSKAVTGQLGKIGSNLNQIARKLNSGEQANHQMTDAIGNCLSDISMTLRSLRSMEDYRGDFEAHSKP